MMRRSLRLRVQAPILKGNSEIDEKGAAVWRRIYLITIEHK